MKLTTFFKTHANVRKIFGDREIKIIEKQALGICLTQSEKNRLSRDIRKKFDVIKELNRFSEEFDLKKGHEIKEIVNDSKSIILNDPDFGNIKKIILFGGAVNNKMTFRSDVDLSVEFFKIDLREATLFKKRFLGKLNDRVDLQVYNILLEKIKKEIDKGRIIHEQQDK